ncbi:hypothetical protein L7F22_013751 [Adiantum nelumboides]|nr:hypothetical protein [Adiantum nelumboides]
MGEFKFTVNYIIDTGSENSEPLNPNDLEDFQLNKRHPRLMQLTVGPSIYGNNWYSELKQRLFDMAERYQDTYIYGIGLYLYAAKNPENFNVSDMDPEVIKNSIYEIVKEQPRKENQETLFTILGSKEESIRERERAVDSEDKAQSTSTHQDENQKATGSYINPSKPDKNTKAFIVGDIETIIVNDIHVPYAIGYVYAGERSLSILDIQKPVTYCTENLYYSGTFKERSRLMFDDFLKGLINYSKICGTKRVYFHNLSRFDGILLLKLLLEDEGKWVLKPIIREHNVYQVLVYDKSCPKSPVLDIRDSLKLLPGSLKSLAETMCPELGGKGSISHEELNEFNISERKRELIKYMEQDILILAGVLRKAQEKYWNRFHIDITNCLTVSSMAMKIYRTHYYPSTYPIYRPQPNKAAFIRQGYYGGHTDVYKPYGKGLFYYNVNSLYPYAMTKPMPGGKPVWRGSLKGRDLEHLFGFVEAKVTCPDSIEVPLLPYKDPKSGTLLFPTGTFAGVYFTEELKLASKVGYQIELRRGYLFEKMESPFSEFVREIYEERLEAKKKGDQVISSLHKLTMNSLYGRFGIKPECNIT